MDDVIVLINNKSQNGLLIDDNDGTQQDNLLRMPSLINAAQREIATVYKKIPATMVISRYPVPSLLPNPLYAFDIVQRTDADISYQAQGAKEYYFEVDYLADIYIEENVNDMWTQLEQISVTTKPTGYEAHKGFITPTDPANTVRIRFSGQYAYRLRNVAFFGVSHAAVEDIPDYQPNVMYDLPADFYQLVPNGIVFRGNFSDGEPFTKAKPFYLLTRDKIGLPYYDKGEYTINYYRYPTAINDDTPKTTALDVDDEAAECISYYVAGHVLIYDYPNIGTTLINEYQQKAQLLNPAADTSDVEILDVTGW